MKNESNLAAIQSLSPNYREQKSREQAAFQKAARGNPEMIKRAQVFRGICENHCVEILLDPSDLSDEERYDYQ